MPLPLGHAAIGFATHSLISNDHSRFNKWRVAIFIVILSNLPDLDVLLGLILQNNGSAFHRGPTHSILFALIMGFAASRSSKFWSRIPMVSFKICFMLILSHVVADYFLTDSPVSFYWPFEVNWLSDSSGWSNVMHTVLFDAVEDAGILIACTGIIMLATIFRRVYALRKTKLLAITNLPIWVVKYSKKANIDL
jgi:inner membrane protein